MLLRVLTPLESDPDGSPHKCHLGEGGLLSLGPRKVARMGEDLQLLLPLSSGPPVCATTPSPSFLGFSAPGDTRTAVFG